MVESPKEKKTIHNHSSRDKNHTCDLDIPKSILVSEKTSVDHENQGIFCSIKVSFFP